MTMNDPLALGAKSMGAVSESLCIQHQIFQTAHIIKNFLKVYFRSSYVKRLTLARLLGPTNTTFKHFSIFGLGTVRAGLKNQA